MKISENKCEVAYFIWFLQKIRVKYLLLTGKHNLKVKKSKLKDWTHLKKRGDYKQVSKLLHIDMTITS